MKDSVFELEVLNRECSVFCRYLIRQNPSEYVQRKYREAHRSGMLARSDDADHSDQFLITIARIHPWTTRLVDVYARVFRKSSVVRKKLILTLAILESCAPTHAYLDSVATTSVPLLLLRSLQQCLIFLLNVALVAVVILPIELTLRGSARFIVLWLPRHG